MKLSQLHLSQIRFQLKRVLPRYPHPSQTDLTQQEREYRYSTQPHDKAQRHLKDHHQYQLKPGHFHYSLWQETQSRLRTRNQATHQMIMQDHRQNSLLLFYSAYDQTSHQIDH